jgi:hypothetical protein
MPGVPLHECGAFRQLGFAMRSPRRCLWFVSARCATVRNLAGRGGAPRASRRARAPAPSRWVLRRWTRRPDPLPAPGKNSRADGRTGRYPQRQPHAPARAQPTVFCAGNGDATNARGFSKKGWPTCRSCAHQKNRAPVVRLGAQFGAEPPVGGGGWPCATTVKAGRVFLIRIGSGLRRFAYSGQRLEVDLLSPLLNPLLP